jgi:CubicO group peptidase (beta-lactamase class C family)
MTTRSGSRRRRPGQVRAAVIAALLVGSCATPSPTPTPASSSSAGIPDAATTDCSAFAPDPSGVFYPPPGLSFHDPSPLDVPTGTPAEVGLDASLLETAATNAALSIDIRSLLVVRHGKLVFERYFNGSDASEAGTIASASKSILSVATGIAIDEGLLTLDARIDAFLPPDVVGTHGDLTIENLLTMSGGLANSEDVDYLADVDEANLPADFSFARQVLKWDSVMPAGTEFAYSTGLTQVLAAVLTEATGQSLCAYVAEHLLGPLGIDVERWWVEPDGTFAGGHSVFMTPRELARFGQLVLQHGAWEGEQLVSADWMDQSLAERWDRGCRPAIGAHAGYGYLWWLYEPEGYRVWNASGYGGQEVWIAPDLDLVIVVTHDTSRTEDPDHHEVLPGAVARAAILPLTEAPREPKCPNRPLYAQTIRPDGIGRSAVSDWPANGLPMSWSQDGRLAIQLDRLDLNSEIYTISPAGTDLERLTFDLAFDGLPSFSPDGTHVAFTRGAPSTSDLYLVSSDGSGETRLTDLDGNENSPTWSADGTRIAFVWGHDEVNGFGETGALWAIDPDGSNRALLLDARVGYPAWSPDGTRIALELRDDDHIAVLDLTTGALADLGPGFVPKWSSDSSRLAVIRETGDAIDIYVMQADGTGVVQLTDDPAFDTFPIWSPDGSSILFLSAAT